MPPLSSSPAAPAPNPDKPGVSQVSVILIKGFTMVEMVITLIIIGTLAALAAPRFFDQPSFAARGFADDVLSTLRYAQKLAVATGCEVQLEVSSNQYTLKQRATNCTSGAFTRDVYHPGTGEATFTGSAPSGVTLTATTSTIVYNALGQASAGYQVSTGGRTFQIVAETGLAYQM